MTATVTTAAPAGERRPAVTADPDLDPGNLAGIVQHHMRVRPDHPALVVPVDWDADRVRVTETCTYGELGAAVTWWRWRLTTAGVNAGDRVLLLVAPGTDFYAALLAVVASGAAVVLVDRAMPLSRIRSSIATAAPDAMVLSPTLRRLARLVPETRRIRRILPVEEGPLPWRGGPASSAPLAPPVACSAGDEAVISFTSGSTGRSEGAVQSHGTFVATHRALAAARPFRHDEVDLAAWPVAVVHALLAGVTSVLPPVRPGRLPEVPAEALLSLAIDQGVTQLQGSPAFLAPILDRARHRAALPALRRIVAGGGPVSGVLCRSAAETFPAAEGVVLYGSTEAGLVARCSMSDLLAAEAAGETRPGAGLLVGTPVDDADARILPLGDGAPHLKGWGEIAFAGPQVMPPVAGDPEAATRSRVSVDGHDLLRSGEIGRIDALGRLWLGGRVADAVEHDGRVIRTYEVEPALDAVSGVVRSALLAGPRGPVVFIETVAGLPVPAEVAEVLGRLDLEDAAVYGPVPIPVDARHQSKVDRPSLRRHRRRVTARAAAHRLVAGAPADMD